MRIEAKNHELAVAQREGRYEEASQLKFSVIPELQKQLGKLQTQEDTSGQSDEAWMVHERVTSEDIARVVAKATGIPVTNLLKGEKEKLVRVGVSIVILS
jgi:ATP-dependent Clp protease ATP-binding subunit ClpB